MKLHQKKFYSSEETDRIIEQHARDNGLGFSESLREIVIAWAEMKKEYITVPIEGTIKDGKVVLNKYWLTKEGMKEAAERG